MKILLVLAAVVLAIVIFRMLRSSTPAGKSATAPKRVSAQGAALETGNQFHAVSVKCGPGACEEAREMGNKRFLPTEITQFPLAGCASANCQCKFEHHADRRDADSDKRAPTALRSELYAASGKPERRTRAGRRKTDKE